MLSRATFDTLLSDFIAPVRDSPTALTVCDGADPSLPIMSVNDAFTELTGYTVSEAVGSDGSFLQGPLTDLDVVARLRQAAHAGVRASGTVSHYRRDGSRFLDDVLISPVHDQTGTFRFLTVVHRERKLETGEAVKRRVRFTLRSGLGLASVAVPGGMPHGWLDRIARSDMPRLAHAAQRCADQGTDLRIPLRLASPAGIESEVMICACRVTDAAQPDDLIYQGFMSEPNSGLLLEPRLRLLEAVTSHANDGIVITEAEPFDKPGPRILYVNQAITRHTGYRQDQLIGLTPRILQGPLTDANETARLGAALRRWEQVTATLLNYRSDGSTFWTEISCTPIADEHGWWTHWVAIQRDITEHKEFSDRLTFLADHDPLTGLSNRRLVGVRLEQSLGKAAANHTSFGVIKVDLDHFKPINDTYGHAAGDAVLSEFALRLNGAVRSSDTIARMGGDEFMVVMPCLASRDDLQIATEHLLASVSGPFFWNGKKLAIAASMGAAIYPEDADSSDGLLIAADTALYQAKARGRGQIQVFCEHLSEDTSEARQMGEDLYDAIERDEFEAFLQPKVRLSDRRLIGFEALVRWNHPRKGLLAPSNFLARAEAGGLTRAIDARVAQQVATLAARWTRAGFDFGRIAINVSAGSFAEPHFVTALAQTLDRAGMDPRHLVIEVVESIFINDGAGNVIEKIDELRRMGVKIELDDFGTGYAALAHLRTFKVDGIKLDHSFVAGVDTNRENEIIVGAVVGLANNLGIGCVAEGIETERQLEFLRDIGCESGQGYLFGRAADGASVTAWLRDLAETEMVVPIGCLLGDTQCPEEAPAIG